MENFHGKLVWGIRQSFFRGRTLANKEEFRLWTELSKEEQEMYEFIGTALMGYFRNTENNEQLLVKIRELETDLEQMKADYLRQRKENGGR